MSTYNSLAFDSEDDEDFNPAQGEVSDTENNHDEAASSPRAAQPSNRGAESDDNDDHDDENDRGRSSKSKSSRSYDDDDDDGNGDEVDEDDEEGEPTGRDGDEDEDDEEEEDEDEEEVRRPSKRKRDRRAVFFDIEADVDEDEDEEDDRDGEEIEGFIEHDGKEELGDTGHLEDERQHRELDRRRQLEASMDAEKIAQSLRERYGNRKSGLGLSNANLVPKRLLLPSVEDPKIWAVRAREGKEREVVFDLCKRMEEWRGTKRALKITAAFERAGPTSVMRGYVYVEAHRQADVYTALENIMNVYPRTKMHLVEIKDMPDLLRVSKPAALTPGSWVRLKKPFKYAGDLAQVIDVTDNGLEARVRFIPRIDYDAATTKSAASRNIGPDGKRKRPVGPGPRPPQRLFSESEARKRNPRSVLGNAVTNIWTYNGEEFENGFLIKDIKIKLLVTENVNPRLEEVTKFASGSDDGTDNIDLKALAASLKNDASQVSFQSGDSIEVFDGEQKGVVGKAVQVRGHIVTLQVTEGPLKGQSIDVPTKGLRKRFQLGDHVKVIGGTRHKDEVGMVVKIEDDRVTIITDSANKEAVVFSKDLREADDSSGQNNAGQFSLQDLVQLDPTTVGCIVKLDRDTITALDQHGDVRQVAPSQIPHVIPPRKNAVAADRTGSEIRVGDVVREYGNLQRRGKIVHMHRSWLFLHSTEMSNNAGIFVTRASNVNTVAAKGGRIASSGGPDLSSMNPALKRNPAKDGQSMPPPRMMRGGVDPAIGLTALIRKGSHKGLLGRVRDANDTVIRLELQARNRIISVPKGDVVFKNPKTGETFDPYRGGGPRRDMGGVGGRPGGAGPGAGGDGRPDARKPSWSSGSGSRTPAFGGAGDRTPAWGSRTPAPSGGRTPAWRANDGGRTPAWASDGSRTVNPYDGSRTAYGSGSRTPAWQSSGSRTPAYSSSSDDVWGGRDGSTPSGNSHRPSDGWPSGGGSGAYDAPTPGAGLLGAPTPAPHHTSTPGAYGGAPTPGPVGAPTPGGGWQGGWGADDAATPGITAPTPSATGFASHHEYDAGPTPGPYLAETPAPRYIDDDDD